MSQLTRIGSLKLALSGDRVEDWYIGDSPHYASIGAEGPWQEWVHLARAILAENKKRNATGQNLTGQAIEQPQR